LVAGQLESGTLQIAVRGIPKTLIIGDLDQNRRELMVSFSRYGWFVREGRSFAEAIQVARKFQPSLIVADLDVHDSGDRSLLRELRSAVDGNVVIIGLATASSLQDVRRLELDDVLGPQPVDDVCRAAARLCSDRWWS
jgi:ActR/RegA family two-component response regulator